MILLFLNSSIKVLTSFHFHVYLKKKKILVAKFVTKVMDTHRLMTKNPVHFGRAPMNAKGLPKEISDLISLCISVNLKFTILITHVDRRHQKCSL